MITAPAPRDRSRGAFVSYAKMSRNLYPTAGPSPANPWLLWPAVVLVGAVFFFVEHNVLISQYETFSPWTETGGSLESGRNVAKGLARGLLGLLGAYLALRAGGRPLRFGGWLPPLVLGYLAWLAASVLWSIDPDMSCRRLGALLCCLVAAVGLARQFRPQRSPDGDRHRRRLLGRGSRRESGAGAFRPWSAEYRFAGTDPSQLARGPVGRPLSGLALPGRCRRPRAEVALGVLCRGRGLSAADQVAGVLRQPAGGAWPQSGSPPPRDARGHWPR